jgi:hypothetical protein
MPTGFRVSCDRQLSFDLEFEMGHGSISRPELGPGFYKHFNPALSVSVSRAGSNQAKGVPTNARASYDHRLRVPETMVFQLSGIDEKKKCRGG